MSAHCLRTVLSALGVLNLLIGSPLAAGDSFVLLETHAALAGSISDQIGKPIDPADPDSQVAAASFHLSDPSDCLVDPGCCGTCGLDRDACVPCITGLGDSSWRVKLVPYGWLYEVQGDATIRGLTAPVSVSYRDTLRSLTHDVDFIFSAKLEIENDQYGLIVDGYYVKVDLDNRLDQLNFDSGFKMTFVDIAGTYNLLGAADRQAMGYLSRFDLLGGIRIWSLEGDLTITDTLGNTATASGTRDWVDPFIGGRIIAPLSEGTELQVRGDVGGFDWGEASRFTWRLDALLAMQCSEYCSLRAGYRILDVNNHQGGGATRFAFDVQFRGPVAELAFEF